MKVSINGHTDNVSGAEFNQTLSENRAKAVYDYLVSKGVDSSRLTYKGYGLTKPLASNDTEEGRAKNRRTEFVIIEK
jgi:outer membrane protein OmpA-like peptidoglycan-associated protein